MRIAFISDVHARLARLEAVLRDIDRVGADEIICLGDVATMGDEPRKVIDRLRGIGCRCIQGNHDEFLLRPGLVREVYCRFPSICEDVECRAEAFTDDEMEYLRSFAPLLRVDLPGGAELLAFHGTPDSNMGMILSSTTDAELDAIFEGHTAEVMIGGHNHEQMLRRHGDRLIVNAGSVGMPWQLPFDGWDTGCPSIASWAEYAIVQADVGSVGVELRRVRCD
jgi:predicted phosphodiesterase